MKRSENNENSFTLILFPSSQLCTFPFQPVSKNKSRIMGILALLPVIY